MRPYGGCVEFVRVNRAGADESAEREITFGPRWLEVQADSPSEAEDKIRALAKSQWRPRKGWNEVMVVRGVVPLDPHPRTYYAFRFESEGDHTARYRTYYGNTDYVPGQLYAFESAKARNEWIDAGATAGEIRKPVRANRLPQGWTADEALDPETGGLF